MSCESYISWEGRKSISSSLKSSERGFRKILGECTVSPGVGEHEVVCDEALAPGLR